MLFSTCQFCDRLIQPTTTKNERLLFFFSNVGGKTVRHFVLSSREESLCGIRKTHLLSLQEMRAASLKRDSTSTKTLE